MLNLSFNDYLIYRKGLHPTVILCINFVYQNMQKNGVFISNMAILCISTISNDESLVNFIKFLSAF